jgi:catechol 2,3-dioxygenase-like lactoylglutathione lyase family enzyme
MFDHVTIRASDRGASERFYETVLETLGVAKSHSDADVAAWDEFGVSPVDGTHPATHGLHVGFVARSRQHVDRFCRAGTEAGYRDDGAPGPRPEYGDDYYGGSCSTPTATAPRPSTTTRCAPAGSSTTCGYGSRTSPRRGRSTPRSRRTPASSRASTRRSARASPGSPGRSRCSRARSRPNTSTWRFPPRTTPPSTGSTPRRRGQAIATTAARGSGRSTTTATTARSCSIRMVD